MTNPIDDIHDIMAEIPLGNSDYQNYVFLIAAQHTPGRAVRAVLLRIMDRLRAVEELKHNRAMRDIDIEELEAKISDPDTNDFDRRRHRLEIERIRSSRRYEDKLLKDALHELDFLYAQLKKLPRYTREQFEAEEVVHFDKRLNQQIDCAGPAQASLESARAMLRALDLDKHMLRDTRNAMMRDSAEVTRMMEALGLGRDTPKFLEEDEIHEHS